MNIKEVFKANPDGFTLIPHLGVLLSKGMSSGYVVGLTDNKVTDNGLERAFIELSRTAARMPFTTTIGGWRDGDDYYLDIGIVVDTLEEAKMLKAIFRQKCFFNLKTWKVEK